MFIQKILSKQLKKPTGAGGVFTGILMNRANYEMYNIILSATPFEPGDKILEIGFGSGRHISRILKRSSGLAYTGIDISGIMVRSARRYNHKLISRKIIEIKKADIAEIPYPDSTFDRVITVNTIYFWDNPLSAMSEIKRVLKPDGTITIGSNSKTEMIKQGYNTNYFRFWEREEIEQLIIESGLAICKSEYIKLKIEDCISVVAGDNLGEFFTDNTDMEDDNPIFK